MTIPALRQRALRIVLGFLPLACQASKPAGEEPEAGPAANSSEPANAKAANAESWRIPTDDSLVLVIAQFEAKQLTFEEAKARLVSLLATEPGFATNVEASPETQRLLRAVGQELTQRAVERARAERR
jgi:hypothetical protein